MICRNHCREENSCFATPPAREEFACELFIMSGNRNQPAKRYQRQSIPCLPYLLEFHRLFHGTCPAYKGGSRLKPDKYLHMPSFAPGCSGRQPFCQRVNRCRLTVHGEKPPSPAALQNHQFQTEYNRYKRHGPSWW